MGRAHQSTTPVGGHAEATDLPSSSLLQNGGRASVTIQDRDTSHLKRLRRWLDLVLGEDATSDVQLALSELATNAIQHGEAGPIEVEVQRDRDDAVHLQVTNPAARAPEIQEQATAGPRGRGLAIVAATASGLTIEFDGDRAVVTCTFMYDDLDQPAG